MYKILDHTADIGIEVINENLEKALEEAAVAMISLSVDLNKVEEKIKKIVEMDFLDYESMVVKYLNEILYLFDAENFVMKRAKVKITEKKLFSELYGENYSREKHGSMLVIKAVTYHMIEVDPKGKIRVLFDI